jgi:hypothetical protein
VSIIDISDDHLCILTTSLDADQLKTQTVKELQEQHKYYAVHVDEIGLGGMCCHLGKRFGKTTGDHNEYRIYTLKQQKGTVDQYIDVRYHMHSSTDRCDVLINNGIVFMYDDWRYPSPDEPYPAIRSFSPGAWVKVVVDAYQEMIDEDVQKEKSEMIAKLTGTYNKDQK